MKTEPPGSIPEPCGPTERPSRAPAVALASSFIAGELSGLGVPIAWGLAGGAGSLLTGMFLAHRRRVVGATGCILFGFFLTGRLADDVARWRQDRQPLRRLHESCGEVAFESPRCVEGYLETEPEMQWDSAVLSIDVETIRMADGPQPANGGLRATVRGEPGRLASLDELQAGDRIHAWVSLHRPRSFRNPGGFDFVEYLGRHGITLSGSIKSARLVERIRPANWGRTLFSRVRKAIRARIQKALEPRDGSESEAAGIVVALLTGDRSLIPPWTELLYQQAGTFHVIAISGAHVGILAWLLYGGLRWIGCDLRTTLWTLVAVMPLYAIFCGASPSVVRAVVMSLGILGARLLSLDASAGNGLAVSSLVLLALRPLDLRDAGFQLSFLATASILAFSKDASRFLAPWLGRLSSLVAVSAAAQVGVVPLLAWHFERLSPAALLVNVLAIPIAAALIVCGALLALVAPIPWVGAGVAGLTRLLVAGLTWSSQFGIAIPGGSFRVVSPSWLWITAYALGLLAAVVLRRRWRGGALAFLGLLTLGLVVCPGNRMAEPRLSLTALDVGHGDALLVGLPSGQNLLIDGGGSFSPSFDVGENVVVPALLHLGVRSLDALVLTHPDRDHLGGLRAVASNLHVKEIWEGQPDWSLAGYAAFRRVAREKGVAVRRLSTGDTLRLGDVEVRVLSGGDWPSADSKNSNARSLVLHFRYGVAGLLLTGDAGHETELTLLASGALERTTVVKLGHHGSAGSTHPAFLEALSPRAVVVSTGGSGFFGVLSTRVLHRLKIRQIATWRTDRDGAVTVTLDRSGRIEAWSFGLHEDRF